MNSIKDLTPQQLRNAADLQERILELQHELEDILGAASGIPSPGGKRRLSAQGLANIRAGARKRWAKFRSENGEAGVSHAPRRRMSAAGRASISARMKARWAAAKKSGRNAL